MEIGIRLCTPGKQQVEYRRYEVCELLMMRSLCLIQWLLVLVITTWCIDTWPFKPDCSKQVFADLSSCGSLVLLTYSSIWHFWTDRFRLCLCNGHSWVILDGSKKAVTMLHIRHATCSEVTGVPTRHGARKDGTNFKAELAWQVLQ